MDLVVIAASILAYTTVGAVVTDAYGGVVLEVAQPGARLSATGAEAAVRAPACEVSWIAPIAANAGTRPPYTLIVWPRGSRTDC